MPKSVLSRRRSWVARLAVLALIASTMVVGAVPASATNTPNALPTYSACVGPATASAGFTDTAGNFAASDIDCIKYYGITQGTTATTFSPSQVVTRWQMALFLTRAAGPAGITLPDGSDQGFTDIGNLDAATQKAINQLKQLGITQGTSATTFSPNAPVTRAQMALFIGRFLSKAVTGPGGTAWTSVSTTNVPHFTDIGNLTVEAYNSVIRLWNLGVTTGTSATTFSPGASVTRAQMAAFIARALANTNARPAGVTIQSSISSGFGALSPALSVSVRDANFQPVANALVDVFRFQPSNTVTSPFDANGMCVNSGEVTTVSSNTICKIDLTDPATDLNGNVGLTGAVTSGATATFYAWTGSTGATFDNDTTASSSVVVKSSLPAVGYKVTTTIPTNAGAGDDPGDKIVKMGTSVTITVQLVDANGAPVAQSGQNVIFTDKVFNNTAEGSVVTQSATTVATDANGVATYTFSQPDPTTGDDTDFDQTISIGGVFTASDVEVEWSDNAAAVTTVVASTSKYVTAAANATNTVTATVYDQYGSPMAGQTVGFTSVVSAGSDATTSTGIGGTAVNRVTNTSGVATLTYSWQDAKSGKEDITATVGAKTGTATVYWVVVASSANYATATPILVADTANDKIVFVPAVGDPSAGVYLVATYDSGDQFNNGATAITMSQFETLLDDTTADNIAVNYNTAGVSVWTRS